LKKKGEKNPQHLIVGTQRIFPAKSQNAAEKETLIWGVKINPKSPWETLWGNLNTKINFGKGG